MAKKTSEAEEKVIQAQAEPVLKLEQYLQRVQVNPGLVASFKYEAKKAGDDLSPRTKSEWHKAFEEQKKRQY